MPVFRRPFHYAGRYGRFIPSLSGGTLYFQSASGTLTSAGALVKQTSRALTGTLTTAGALVKQTGKVLAGTFTTVGALAAVRTVLMALTATLTTAGALVKQTGKVASGTLTMAGALVKQVAVLLRGGLGAQQALRFFGGGNSSNVDKVYIRCGEPSNALNVGAADFTLEWWVLADSGNTSTGVTEGANYSWIEGNIMVDRDLLGSAGNGGDWGSSLDDGRVAFGVEDSLGNQYTIIGTSDLRDGQWHHVAVTYQYSTGDIAVYVDGAREALRADAVPNNSDLSYDDARSPSTYDPFVCLGGEKHALDWPQGQFIGRIDEFRVSNTLRYTGTSYTVPTAPFIADSNTMGLFHFDENAGTVVRDSSGNNLDGSFTVGGAGNGPQWADSGARLSRASGVLTTIKAFFLSLTATLTTSGALVKQARRSLVSTLTTSGALVKQAQKVLAGTLTTAGALTAIRTVLMALTATLTTSGALVKQTGKVLSGSVSSAGALVKQAQKALAGALSTAGALTAIRTVLMALTATLTTSGALVKQTGKIANGALTMAGALVKQTSRALTGTLTTAGALVKQAQKILAGTMTTAGALASLLIPFTGIDAGTRKVIDAVRRSNLVARVRANIEALTRKDIDADG